MMNFAELVFVVSLAVATLAAFFIGRYSRD
jgi:hypothetical protein